MTKRTDLTVTAFEEARNNVTQGGYKYLIKGQYLIGYSAYRTDEGFESFLRTRNVKLRKKDEWVDGEYGKVTTYDVIGEVEDRSFWGMDEIPEGAGRFTGLTNGKLVDCYYVHTENGAVIYKPNPNAKEVYQPMEIDEHIEFQRIYG